jgi:lipid-binding SYLF domain-containing protein
VQKLQRFVSVTVIGEILMLNRCSVKSFVDSGNNGLDGVIPRNVLENAKGFAIFTIFKAGFLFSARAGSGIVIAKLNDGCTYRLFVPSSIPPNTLDSQHGLHQVQLARQAWASVVRLVLK